MNQNRPAKAGRSKESKQEGKAGVGPPPEQANLATAEATIEMDELCTPSDEWLLCQGQRRRDAREARVLERP